MPGKITDSRGTVIQNETVGGEYRHLVLQGTSESAEAVPGQFFNLQCPVTNLDQPILRRPMSVYRADRESNQVEFLYKVTGAGTRTLASLRAGGSINIFGPLGRGFTIEPSIRHIVIVGRGVGLATLAPLAEMAQHAKVAVTAILSARCHENLLSVDRFAAVGANVELALDSNGTSDLSSIEKFLRHLVAKQPSTAFYTCGSNRLMLLLQRLSIELSIPGQVALEQKMACGIGMCFTCVRHFRGPEGIETLRVCLDGPVFDLKAPFQWQ